MPKTPPSRKHIEELHALVSEVGFPEAARRLKMPERTARDQLNNIAPRVYEIAPPAKKDKPDVKSRRYLDITDGVAYCGSDAHYWPGPAPTAHRAFCKFLRREKNLAFVSLNGDAYDFPNISQWDSDWFKTPEVKDELEVVDERLGEIVKASGKAKRFFKRGNHDVRFDRYLAKNAPEMRGVSGMCIEDRNPLWEVCWSLFINDADPANAAVIKHRPPRGGIHSTTNSPLHSGRTTVCGHLHSLQVRPFTDYNGTRWGVDCGCLADTFSPQFSYLEDAPRSWRSGFVRLKWQGGRLLTPEIIRVVEDGVVEFRGELIEV